MSYFSDTADFRWNQACIVDLGARKSPIWRVGGGANSGIYAFMVEFDKDSSISDCSRFWDFSDPMKT